MPGALLGPFGRYELGTEIVTIGRSSSNKLVISDNQVSGRHLQVLPQGTDYLLVDVGSSNGTTVNGQRLTPQAPQLLRSGDVIIIGNTRLTIELAALDFPAAPGPAPQGEVIFAPPQQAGIFPPATDDPVFPPYVPPAPAAPPFGVPAPQAAPLPPGTPAPQGPPFPSATPQAVPFPPPNYGAQAPQDTPFSPAGPPLPGAPFPSAAPGPTTFDPFLNNAPGQVPVNQPNAGATWSAPPAFGGPPGVGAGLPPARVRTHRNRTLLLIGAVVALVVILGVSILIFLKFTGGGQSAAQGTPTPAIAQEVIMPFYEDLEKQDYNAATSLFTSTLLQLHGGVTGWTRFFQFFDQQRGKVTAFTIDPLSGSGNTRMANVKVTRDPTKGTFKPDLVVVLYQQGKWQINNWMIGMR